MHNLPAPRSKTELRAPKIADIRGDRDSPAAGLQAPRVRDYNGKPGDQGHNFPLSEASRKAGSPVSTDPREGSTTTSPRIASTRSASKKETGSPSQNLDLDGML